jgi:ATP-binding cassette, subfamily C, bacterial CydC
MNDLKEILIEFTRFKGRVSLSLFLGIMTVTTGVGLIAASGYLISWAALRPPILDLILVLVAVRFFGISRAAFRYAERLFSHDLTFRILKNLRVHFYQKVEPLLPAKAIRFKSADLLTRFSDDVDQLQEFYLKTVSPTLIALFFITVTAIVLSIYSVTLSVIVLILMIVNAAFMPFLVRYKAGQSARELSMSSARLGQYMSDHIRGSADLIFSGQYSDWMKRGEEVIDELSEVQKTRARAFSMESGLFTLLSHASIPVSFLILLPLVVDGTISGLVMTAIILGLFSVFESLEPMGNALQHFYESKEAASRLNEVTREEEQGSDELKIAEFSPKHYSIHFDNVFFGYNSSPVLNGFSLEVQQGEHVILKGASGCGKSTAAHLLVKWFEPWRGKIMIGDLNIGDFSGKEVRRLISVVSQNTRLFNTSLRNNLKIAQPDATDEDLAMALEKVGFSEALRRLPEGLSTQVGELGLRLSGGERQRVSLARALLKDAPIWILDEPLSSLDRKMAEEIMLTLNELIKEKTVLHITHQNSRLFTADNVYHMVDGAIKLEAIEPI